MEKTDIPGVYLVDEAPEPGARSTLRGHPIVWDGEQWRYVDTGEPTVGNRRHCGHCGFKDTPDGHDWCLHELPGVRNACCGHGDPAQAYIQFETGMIVRGFCIDRAPPSPPRSPAMTEHESREALRERIACELWVLQGIANLDNDPGRAESARSWWSDPKCDPEGKDEYRRAAERVLALLPVAPVVGERDADHQRAIRGFDDDGEPVCICGLTFWSDDVCVDCGDTENAAYSRMARRRALAARTPEEHG